MLNRFRHLELLSLIRSRGIPDSGLTPLQMYGSKLQSLNLFFFSRVTDKGLSYVASESCKSLKHVDLSLCSGITDNGVQCLSQNCRQLTKLWISGCDKILGKGFQGVSPTLACLEAKNCPFDSEGVSAVLSGGIRMSRSRKKNLGRSLPPIGPLQPTMDLCGGRGGSRRPPKSSIVAGNGRSNGSIASKDFEF
ncbi:hypothetical protein CTI12_AA011870 [Artemisia annua]|uniref:Leucine-rich repeat domain, L domain-like protein n=1 Tax=Artemisia annua TaxID=35608 RepID=A0A2U1QMC2_ARTAN|nr:hypothetical protein CTI12_AA011870 [Artemisia annua]